MGSQTIALCMIVRDESAVIDRCLASVEGLVDTWVICDTGSVDDTTTRIKTALADVPGELHHSEWRDFGHNRSELMDLARGAADYLLLLDADMTVERHAELPPLDADAYLLRHAGDLDYRVPRLVRGDRAWRFEGATHEYLAADELFGQRMLDELVVVHHADGGSRHDKLERDRRLLEQALGSAPDDGRTLFYLAQTHRDLGDRPRAIDLYRRRVEVGGWDEEVFYAQYQVGVLLADDDWEAGAAALLQAWELRPTRAEPLYELARGSRTRGQNHSALLFARAGLDIPSPDDVLFVHRDVYDHLLRFEHSLAAYWTGDYETALADNETLLAQGVPSSLEPWVHHNRQWCLQAVGRAAGSMSAAAPVELDRVQLLADVAPTARIDGIVIPLDTGWAAMNPTIAADGDGYRMVVRAVNYDLVDGYYHVRDPDRVVRTRNFLVTTDAQLAIRTVEELPMLPDGPPLHPGVVLGCEDCRLIDVGGTWYASATVRDRSRELRCEMALLALDGADVDAMVLLPGLDPERHEKNWMPFVHDGTLHFLYSCAPTIVLRCNASTGTHETVAAHTGPEHALGFRGGSQGVAVDDGWLFAVHETAQVRGTTRTYVHRLVHLDREFRLDAISAPFAFVAPGVEFCAGLARRDDEVVMTFGAGDRAAYAARAPLAELLALLEPITG